MVLRNNRKALNQVDVLHRISVFKVGFVSYPSVTAIRLLSQKKVRLKELFVCSAKPKKIHEVWWMEGYNCSCIAHTGPIPLKRCSLLQKSRLQRHSAVKTQTRS